MAHFEQARGKYRLSTERARIDVIAVHSFLSRSYWAEGIPLELVERAIAGSLCFSVLDDDERQVGFARVVTDRSTFAYLCDVFIVEECRGLGLGRWLVEGVMAHPELQGLRRFVLVTRDAHALYEKLGFEPLANPAGYMEIAVPDIYKRGSNRERPVEESGDVADIRPGGTKPR